MRRTALLGFAAVGAVALVGMLALALTRESPLVYTIGAGPGGAIAELERGDEICQAPLSPPRDDAFDRVVISLGTYFKPGSPVEVLVRPADDEQEVLARGMLAGGYGDIGKQPEHSIPVDRTTTGEPVAICVRNTGARKVAAYGAPDIAHRTSTASVDGKKIGRDLAVRLERSDQRSLLARLPDAFDHAALFKGGLVGAWTFWLLAAVVLLGVPALLAVAIARAMPRD